MFALLTAPGEAGRADVRLARSTPADLVRMFEPAPGVAVEIDLADPSRWHGVEVRRWDAADPALLGALLGRDAVRRLALGEVPQELAPAAAWRRLAVIDALDWWLQLPLNQGLLDAERAIARARAAASLPAGLLRRTLVDRALVQARRSADAVTAYLDGLDSLPRALFSGMSRLVGGYVALAQEVDGPDSALSAVPHAWKRLKAPVVDRVRPAETPVASVGTVDPRQVRARIVGDVRMVASGRTSVRVVVPAFVPAPSPVVADRLMVRLVDRRSGEAQEPALLTLRSDGLFSEVLALRGAALEHLRAEVFDADSEPVRSEDLFRVRRAQLVLCEWRRAVVEARLTRNVRTRNRRLARLFDTLAPVTGPLFHGGPTRTDLLNGAWSSSTAGAGAPLVAELAAAHH
ncbi:hypothetical protein [Kribbella shirazensis]|uniref:Uncharacterized protein n=1 Tax=Kribbella shirazensis TaxID=1105143 RepID=A0A7X5V571_9ACTN|nr:hypothetical protein [Kribbella shirazensis]NIK54795.1 hypothetical protein [Kribbella shirazensis]